MDYRRGLVAVAGPALLLLATACGMTSQLSAGAPNFTRRPAPVGIPSPPPSSLPKLEHTAGATHVSKPIHAPVGWEVLTADDHGHVKFWQWRAVPGRWSRAGVSTYPTLQGQVGPLSEIEGAALSGLRDATFLLFGGFSGDGSGNVIAYGNGSTGWGPLVTGGDLLTTRSGLHTGYDGVYPQAAFTGGKLRIDEMNQLFDNADSGAYPLSTWWTGESGLLRRDHDNTFTAHATTAPPQNLANLGHHCPVTGTYTANFVVVPQTSSHVDAPVAVRLLAPDGTNVLACEEQLPPSAPIELAGTTGSFDLETRWMTAPAWTLRATFLNASALNTTDGEIDLRYRVQHHEMSRWIINPSLAINYLTSRIPDPNGGPDTAIWTSVVTFSGGHLTKFWVVPAGHD